MIVTGINDSTNFLNSRYLFRLVHLLKINNSLFLSLIIHSISRITEILLRQRVNKGFHFFAKYFPITEIVLIRFGFSVKFPLFRVNAIYSRICTK